jgi:CYTH domain-containing protein
VLVGVEIERRFLVVEPPALAALAYVDIAQGYLALGDGGGEVRVRQAGERRTLTVKSGFGLVRRETEIELTAAQYEALWPATLSCRLEKRRYTFPADGRKFEVDVYGGDLNGLIVAEIEFESVEASRSFLAPSWCVCEVTEDDRFRNRSILALTPDGLRALLAGL